MTSREQFEKWYESGHPQWKAQNDFYGLWEAWQASRAWMPIESAPLGVLILIKGKNDVIFMRRLRDNLAKSRYAGLLWQYRPE